MFEREMVPEVVIVPPVSPVPAVTPVTVPVGAEAGCVFVIVRLPATPEIEIPGPAVKVITPEFDSVMLPVVPEAKIPGPAMRLLLKTNPNFLVEASCKSA